MTHPNPAAGAIVTIRRERWRILRAGRRRDVIRLDAVSAGGGARAITFFAPFDRLAGGSASARPKRVRPQRWRAALDGLRANAEHVHLPLAALGATIRLLPYQLEPLMAVRDGARRVLIADAVGLGKTIQAGLIAAELIRRGEAARILVLTPGHLCLQWHEELAARFRLSARLADASSLAQLTTRLPRHTSPWSLEGVWIASLDFVKQSHVRSAMTPAPWDLVVIDEVHTATGDSERRAAASELAGHARRLVLLTATPFSGLTDGRALLNLGALPGDDDLIAFRRTRAALGLIGSRQTRTLRIRPHTDERRMFQLLAEFDRAATRAATAETSDATRLLLSVLRKRALSSAQALALSAARRLAHLDGSLTDAMAPTQAPLDFGDDDGAAMRAEIGMRADRERPWMRRLQAGAAAASRASRKLRGVIRLIARAREAVIVFTEFRDSLAAIASALHRRHVAVAVVHGGLTAPELMQRLTTFTSGTVRVLLATDVASQGLNLHQRARWVIHFDLPWNPVRLEQREGRVDRLGQTRHVHVTRIQLALADDAAFAETSDGRRDVADAMAPSSDARWHRRARAAARVLADRRHRASRWRGPLPAGRPLAARGAPFDVYQHDIAGAESVIARVPSDSAALSARHRRVTRIVDRRQQRALAVERALRARLVTDGRSAARGDAQARLPGAVPAPVTRSDEAARADQQRALDDVTERIAALGPTDDDPTVASSLRLTRY